MFICTFIAETGEEWSLRILGLCAVAGLFVFPGIITLSSYEYGGLGKL